MTTITTTINSLNTIGNSIDPDVVNELIHDQALDGFGSLLEAGTAAAITSVSTTQATWTLGGFVITLDGMNLSPVGSASQLQAAIDNAVATGSFSNISVTQGATEILSLTPSSTGWALTSGVTTISFVGDLPGTLTEVFDAIDLIDTFNFIQEILANGGQVSQTLEDSVVAEFEALNFGEIDVSQNGNSLLNLSLSSSEYALTLNGVTYAVQGSLPEDFGSYADVIFDLTRFNGDDVFGLPGYSISGTEIRTSAGANLVTFTDDGSEDTTFIVGGVTYGEVVLNLVTPDRLESDYYATEAYHIANPSEPGLFMGFDGNDRIYLTSIIVDSSPFGYTEVTAPQGYVVAGAGNDTVYGSNFNDTIDGGSGSDLIYGGHGDDFIQAGADNDIVDETDGDNTILGGAGDDQLNGGLDSDTVFGGTGNDSIRGNSGSDAIYGNDGADTILGGSGTDLIFGNNDNDSIQGDSGDDTIVGGTGRDTIYGNGEDDLIRGGGDADRLLGGFGSDTLDGGFGWDVLIGNDGDDYLQGRVGDDRLDGGAGRDTLEGDAGNDNLYGNGGDDILRGGGDVDRLFGGFGNDSLDGSFGWDVLVGNDGADTLNGGIGNDRLTGGADADVFQFALGDGSDTVFDYTDGVDQIEILSGASTFGDLVITANGGNALVTFGSVSIQLNGVSDTVLDASDFIF